MLARRIASSAALFALVGSACACSVLFGLEGFAGPGPADAGGDASGQDASTEGGGDCGSPPGLVAYWKLDEGEGGVTSDSTGNGNTGVLVGNPVWVMDAHGTSTSPALRFDGTSNQYVDFADPADLQLSGSMTLSAWFNVAAFVDGGPDMPILSKRSVGDRGWQIYVSEAAVAFDVATDMSTYKPALYSKGASSLATATWYHVVAVYDIAGPSLTLYLDGAPVGALYGDAGVPATQYDPSNHVHLGNSAGCFVGDAGSVCPESQLFHGSLDEVRVYAAALTPCQVQAIP